MLQVFIAHLHNNVLAKFQEESNLRLHITYGILSIFDHETSLNSLPERHSPAHPLTLVASKSADTTTPCNVYFELIALLKEQVQPVGIEPTRYYYHRILSPARLPVPP